MNLNQTKTSKGFTLVELMITIAVLAILLVIAIPSFNEFRQRAAIRGAADQIASFWGDARFEALRRNEFVKVGFVTNAAGSFCIGAATTATSSDDTPCDCLTANACNVSAYPGDQSEWRNISVATATDLGDVSGGVDIGGGKIGGVIVVDPKRGNITEPGTGTAGDEGIIYLRTPDSSNANYRLNIVFDRNGRAIICEPSAATNKLPQFTNRRC